MTHAPHRLTARILPVVSLVLSGCAVVHGNSGHSPGTGAELQGFEELIQRVRSDYAVPALAAAFVRNGGITAVAVGEQRLDQGRQVSLDDRFHVGSVSKPISATVIATLVEEKLLGWQSTVADVFPDLAGQVNPAYLGVTLEQLLSHRAGIVAWEEDEEIALAPRFTGSPRQQRRAAVLWLLTQAPVAPPGTEHVYSNAGYMVAAAMAENVSGLAWEELLYKQLVKPLGLTSIGFGWPARSGAAQPWGHLASPGGFVPDDPNSAYQAGPLLAPAGDLQMNITDLARFAQLHLEGLQGRATLLSTESFQKLHHPTGDYALGWNVRETADHHFGGLGTFLAAIWVSVPRNIAVVVVTNADADEGIVSTVINGSLRAFHVPKP